MVVSIFVNPTQFGPNEDLSRYPRPIIEDTALCRAAGVDILFVPTAAAMYAPDSSTWVDETRLSLGLCGGSRPGHFRGVCTVVAKLFNITGPHMAVFGEKDAQQLAVIRRMVRDLNFPVKVVALDTVREADGLALSSRNRYLSAAERAEAVVLRKALLAAREQAKSAPRDGAKTSIRLVSSIRQTIGKAPLARIDYIEAVDAENFGQPSATTRRLLIAVAVFFGKTRLIDNIEAAIR